MRSPIWLLLALAVAASTACASEPSPVLAPQEKVAGRSQTEYAIAWWQWVMRLPDGVRAYQDPSGAQCALNQSGPVWFLADTEGTDHVRRQCALPVNTYVFLPIIAMLAHSAPGQPLTCKEAQAEARNNNDHLADATVLLDGKPIADVREHRLRSIACFDAFADAKYVERHNQYMPAATEGYWLMLAPLRMGVHRLSVHARYDNPGKPQGDLEQVFEYELRVGETPALDAPPKAGPTIAT